MSLIYLTEIDGYFVSGATIKTFRFCSGKGYNDDTNPMSGIYYEPRIEQPALLSYDMLSDLKIAGISSVGYGELTLINNDGGLDYLNAYTFDGRSVVIKAGDDQAAYASFVTVFKGIVSHVDVEYSRVAFRIKDKVELLERPLQTISYLGNNSLPSGLEGDISLKGKPKPLVYGETKNVTPVMVNTSRLIYQVSSDAVASIPKVFDKGVELTFQGSYSSQLDMETNAPDPGNFKVWESGGMFRLGSSPAGSITCDVVANDVYLSDILVKLLTSDNGIDLADIVMDDFSGMAAAGFIVDLYVAEALTITEAVDAVCTSVGVSWWFDNLGRFRATQLAAPVSGSVATFTDVEILSLDRNTASIDGKPYPVWSINVGYDKNWTIQTPDQLAGSVTDARKAWLEHELRYYNFQTPAIKTINLFAQNLSIDSPLSSSIDAAYQAVLLAGLWHLRSVFYSVVVRVDAALLNVLNLNAVVTIMIDRFGVSSGTLTRVVAIKTDYQRNQVELKLWGIL
jgi:hypothetical protein